MNPQERAIMVVLAVMAAFLIIPLILPVIPVTKQATFYNAEIGSGENQVYSWSGRPSEWYTPHWLIINTSEGTFVVTDDFIIKSFRGNGANCDFRMCFNSPNDYHITLHKYLTGADDTFMGMTRVVVTP